MVKIMILKHQQLRAHLLYSRNHLTSNSIFKLFLEFSVRLKKLKNAFCATLIVKQFKSRCQRRQRVQQGNSNNKLLSNTCDRRNFSLQSFLRLVVQDSKRINKTHYSFSNIKKDLEHVRYNGLNLWDVLMRLEKRSHSPALL